MLADSLTLNAASELVDDAGAGPLTAAELLAAAASVAVAVRAREITLYASLRERCARDLAAMFGTDASEWI
jgi:hypothetical protein